MWVAGMSGSWQRRALAAALATTTVASGLAACGTADQPRTAAGFCKTYTSEKTAFLNKYAALDKPSSTPQSGTQVLTDLVMGVQSLGDVTVILTKLDKAAPSDIEPDVSAVLASWKKMQDTLGDEAGHAFNPTGLVGDLLKGLLVGVESNGSWTRVGDYVSKNCTT